MMRLGRLSSFVHPAYTAESAWKLTRSLLLLLQLHQELLSLPPPLLNELILVDLALLEFGNHPGCKVLVLLQRPQIYLLHTSQRLLAKDGSNGWQIQCAIEGYRALVGKEHCGAMEKQLPPYSMRPQPVQCSLTFSLLLLCRRPSFLAPPLSRRSLLSSRLLPLLSALRLSLLSSNRGRSLPSAALRRSRSRSASPSLRRTLSERRVVGSAWPRSRWSRGDQAAGSRLRARDWGRLWWRWPPPEGEPWRRSSLWDRASSRGLLACLWEGSSLLRREASRGRLEGL